MIRAVVSAALALLILPTPAGAALPSETEQRVRAVAEAKGFDGAILIGDASDGSNSVLTLGAKPVDAHATWRWASITKQLAAVIAMQEVAAGRLDLDAPVSRYWPEWRSPAASTIRIRDLWNHNSGLPQPDASKLDADGVPAFYRSAAVSPSESANGFCAGPVKAKAPAEFDYNNCDTIVLSEVFARLSGKPFAELLAERLTVPLGLTSVGLFERAKPVGHVLPIGEGRAVDALIDLGVFGASGGAYGTIADLWRFDQALLQGRLVPKDKLDVMWTAPSSNGFLNAFQWTYMVRLAGCSGPVKIVERQGLIGGIELRNWLLPESGRGLILFGRKRPTDIGDPWMGKGFGFDLLSAVACPLPASVN